ncbi:MAG: sigma-70 family RNA polymerase sigma factor [Firmicutes bacterium]|nr:sigma-70 family RNA polymerase sigma factor [Bacillota bacterium]
MINHNNLEQYIQQYIDTRNKKVLEKIILECYPMIEYIAEKFALRSSTIVEVSDLVSYGIIGLLKCIDSFRPEKGASFTTYAYIRIQGSIQDGLRSIDWVSSGARKKVRFLDNLYSQLVQRYLRNPSHEEMAQALNITLKELGKMLREKDRVSLYPLDIPNTRQLELTDPVGDPIDCLINRETESSLREAIGRLPAREKKVIEMYYYESRSLTEIAKIMNVSLSCISRIHKRAITRLKNSYTEGLAEADSF